ncbi:MAG: Fur family transcriptional regulator [Candidatus Promineifilaceae bacterium]
MIQNNKISKDYISQQLKEVGLRLTPQRLLIYQTLLQSKRHPTAQALYDEIKGQLPSLSQATVYNTLQALGKAGLIQEIGEAGDGTIHYDANLTPHVNLICIRCHRVDDFFDVPLNAVAQQVAGQSGYQIQGARVAYYGLCPECQTAVSAQNP